MADDHAPLVRLDPTDAAKAPTRSYNVSDPTSYPGRSYLTLDFGDNHPFATAALVSAAPDYLLAAIYQHLDAARRAAADARVARLSADAPTRLRHRAAAASGPDPALAVDLARLGRRQAVTGPGPPRAGTSPPPPA